MFAIVLRPAEIQLGGALIRCSRRITSELADKARDAARARLETLRTCAPSAIAGHLAELHEMQQQVTSVIRQTSNIARELREASAILSKSEAPRGNSPLLHACLQAHAAYASVKAAVPDGDFRELDEAVEQLNDTAAELEKDAQTAKGRAEKLAGLLQEASVIGLSRAPVKQRATVAAYDLPPDLADLCEGQPLAGKAAAAAAWLDDKTASRERQKMARRDRQRQELKSTISEVWA
ncbi:hypothetical protein [Alloyangia pacifica]|uniref:Uncharacterized protein n=1 Tax=Alloyangia pacifica TaxID=311180 RepID=A0A1I6PR06_9RHOB|nr:hypothetical protein [Alloyangia pacifica]SDG33608.1 hypothetical protein SAMN04488245_102410 [Alloyangia pacifica]SFS42662.1 hypothetical protein SAMN04488050_101711 [Alloyangia pacifica]